MKINNKTKNTLLVKNCWCANSFLKRFLGLMGKHHLEDSSGLILVPCNSIHTYFMRFSIDVIFVNKNNKVIYLLENFKPWKLSKIIKNSASVIELKGGTIKESLTSVGDTLEII